MEAGDGETESRRTVWLGQEFVDEGTMSDVKNVVRASVILAGLQLLSMLLAWRGRLGHLGSALLNFAVGMLLPACGYFGATHSSSDMMHCFCSCNLCVLLCQILFIVVILSTLFTLNGNPELLCESSCTTMTCGNFSELCSCQSGCNLDPLAEANVCCNDFRDVCVKPQKDSTPVACREFQSDFQEESSMVSICFVVIMLPSVCLSTYAWYYGMKLWRRLSTGERFVVPSEGATALRPSGADQEAPVE